MKKLLLTGAAGFLGRNIIPDLKKNYSVKTLGRSANNDVRCDLSESIPDFTESYDIVLHAAGKAHIVPKTEEERETFYKVNLEGTKNLCAGLERVGVPNSFVFISTVAVYGLDTGEDISEEAELKGNTPYALSKILAEQYLADWCSANGVKLSILRLPLVAGVNPPGNLGAMIKGIKSGRYLSIGKADARKSVVMAVEVARLLPVLEDTAGVYNISDGYDPSFGELEMLIARQQGRRKPLAIPYWMAKLMAKCGDVIGRRAPINSYKLGKIVNPLTFSSKKAQVELNWIPLRVLENFKIS